MLSPITTNYQMRWTPDGRALAYIGEREGVSNIFLQRLDGSRSKPLTDFHDGTIFAFDWSPDGKRIACIRGSMTSDVVLLHGAYGWRSKQLFSR